ncbi:MAG TPA: hypothetical protein VFN53_12735 [Acidobacteriaceae bacterium]|nr:hypothetical protein [Acidobacteriaceae bacterium]
MQSSKLSEYAAKIVCAIFCADFLTMLLMNTARLYVHWLPILFFASLAVFGAWIFRSEIFPETPAKYMTARERRALVLLVLLAAVLTAGVRLPYLMEGHLHHLVGPVVYDDTWHFQELNSLVHSIRYPAQCSLIPDRYFSFYYAPWMMIAAIYLALPVHGFTIKAAFAIGCAIYQILLCLTMLYIGLARSRSPRQIFAAVYLIAFWSGVDSIATLMYYMTRRTWWFSVLQMPIHFPIFFGGLVWAPHHLSAAVALLLAWHLWDIADDKSRTLVLTCSLLIAYAFYSSVFVFLGALPLGIWVTVFTARKNYGRVLTSALVAAVWIWPLLWLYLGKSNDVRFLFPFITRIQELFPYTATLAGRNGGASHSGGLAALGGIAGGFAVFLIYICMNFFPGVFLLARFGKKLEGNERWIAGTAILFLLSTYFVGFPEGDNYASRGYVVPILVLSWICAGLLPSFRISPWVVAGLFFGSFGLLHEAVFTYRSALHVARAPLDSNHGQAILALNQDRANRTVPVDAIAELSLRNPDQTYYVEKFVPGGRTHPVVADRQLECAGPHGVWGWQRNPDIP